MQDWLRAFFPSPDSSDEEGSVARRHEDSDIDRLTDAETQSEFSHELYIDSRNLTAALGNLSVSRTLEVGCGYGRLTPWIMEHTDEHYAIDLARSLLTAAQREYPGVQFQQARAEALPFRANAFDLAVTWGVLNHVPSDAIQAAAAEIDRVVVSGGTLLISEATAGTPDPRWEYRSIKEWTELFSSRELAWHAHTERDEESFRDPNREHVVMKFK